MGKTKGLVLPAIAALAMLVAGVALVVFLPSPEERAFKELLQVEIESVRWNGITPREAVAEVNAEIQRVSDTRYRLILSEDARTDIPVVLELNHASAVECAEYLAQESGNSYYLTARGYVIDRSGRDSTHYTPSWRSDLRHWMTSTVPQYWRRLRGEPAMDPFRAH